MPTPPRRCRPRRASTARRCGELERADLLDLRADVADRVMRRRGRGDRSTELSTSFAPFLLVQQRRGAAGREAWFLSGDSAYQEVGWRGRIRTFNPLIQSQ